MNSKRIIQIIVILCAFAGSGVVLYNGFYKNQTARAPTSSPLDTAGSSSVAGAGNALGTAVSANGIDQILPNGGSLNLDIVKRPNVIYDTLILPKLDPKLEVGIDVSQLIVPLPAQPAAK